MEFDVEVDVSVASFGVSGSVVRWVGLVAGRGGIRRSVVRLSSIAARQLI